MGFGGYNRDDVRRLTSAGCVFNPSRINRFVLGFHLTPDFDDKLRYLHNLALLIKDEKAEDAKRKGEFIRKRIKEAPKRKFG